MGMTIREKVLSCRVCGIRKYQQPLLDKVPDNSNLIMCVDYAAPKLPASVDADSGSVRCFPAKEMLSSVIKEMQKSGYDFYHSYLLKCTPMLDNKSRKPFKHELRNCFLHFMEEVNTLKPKAVLLMGQNTYLTVLSSLGIPFKKWQGVYFDIYEHNQICYIPISHPSMLDVSRPNNYDIYIDGINNVLRRCIEQ